MATITAGIHADGIRPINAELDALTKRASDFRPVFAEMRAEFYEIERDLFDSEGASGAHGKWAELKPVTIARKASQGLDPRILQATSDLFNSLTHPNAKGSRGRMTPDVAEFGTTITYAEFLRKGTRNMVARRPVDMTESQEQAWVLRIQRFIMGPWL